MPRKPLPPPEIEVVVEDSPEARAAYLDALRLVVRHIREKRQRADETKLKPSA